MSREDLISVIVPVYNIEDYLPRCLSCLEIQTYRNLDIILVDDGSTDSSGKICDEFAAKDPRARVIHHPSNMGLWAARNSGHDVALGDYLWFPDGDDYFHKDIVKLMHEAILRTNSSEKQYDLAMVAFRKTSNFDEDVFSEIESPAMIEKPLEDVLEAFMHPTKSFNGKSVWNKLCRKTLIQDVRTGDYKYSQDIDFSIKVYLKNPSIVFVDKELYYFVNRPTSAQHSQGYEYHRNHIGARILYDNLMAWKGGENKCLRYMLEELYIRMSNLLECVKKEALLSDIRRECNDIIRHTWKPYLLCNAINTPLHRVLRLLRCRFNKTFRLWRVVMGARRAE